MLEKTLESPMDFKEIHPVHPKGNQSWIFIGRIEAEAETLILWPHEGKSWLIWKDPNAGKKLKAGGEGDNRGWDGWMVSPTQRTRVCINSRSWWWTGRPGVLQSMGFQSVGHNWATELNWTQQNVIIIIENIDKLDCSLHSCSWVSSNFYKVRQSWWCSQKQSWKKIDSSKVYS